MFDGDLIAGPVPTMFRGRPGGDQGGAESGHLPGTLRYGEVRACLPPAGARGSGRGLRDRKRAQV